MNTNNVCIMFYSKKCEHSMELIKLLDQRGLISMFKFICVDDNNNIPPCVESIPTIIVNDISKPLIGSSAFRWINTITQFQQPSNNILVSKEIDKYATPDSNPLLKHVQNIDGPNGIIGREMIDVSDNYAFVDEDDKHSKDIQKNLVGVKDKEQLIITAPEIGKKLDGKTQYDRLNQLINKRSVLENDYYKNDQFININNPNIMKTLPQQPMNMPNGLPINIPTTQPMNMPNRLPMNMPNGLPMNMPNRLPMNMPNGLPMNMPNGSQMNMPNGLPMNMPNGLPMNMPNRLPMNMPNGLPMNMPNGLPMNMPNGLPMNMPNGLPMNMPNRLPTNIPNIQTSQLNPTLLQLLMLQNQINQQKR